MKKAIVVLVLLVPLAFCAGLLLQDGIPRYIIGTIQEWSIHVMFIAAYMVPVVLACLITHVVTVRHYLRHHLGDVADAEIKAWRDRLAEAEQRAQATQDRATYWIGGVAQERDNALAELGALKEWKKRVDKVYNVEAYTKCV